MSEGIPTEQKRLMGLEAQRRVLVKRMDAAQVTNDEEEGRVEELLADARLAHRQALDLRLEFTRPLDESKAKILAMFRPHILGLETAINDINARLGEYRRARRIEAETERIAALARGGEGQEGGE